MVQTPRPIAFLACSSEAAVNIAPSIQAMVSRSAIVQMWTQDFFRPGRFVLEELVDQAGKFDFCLILFAADDIVNLRGKKYIAARDNTVLEAGLFISKIGRYRTLILLPDMPNLRLPSDLAGLTVIKYPAKPDPDLISAELGPACREIVRAIDSLGFKEITAPITTGGMLAVMKVFESALVLGDGGIELILATFSGAITLGLKAGAYEEDVIIVADKQHTWESRDETREHKGWEKAGQYCVLFLISQSFIRRFQGTRVCYELTDVGKAFLKGEIFEDNYRKLAETQHGSRMSNIIKVLGKKPSWYSGT